MARLARVVAPGLPHHVTQRGNRRQQTFFCDADYETYLDLMRTWCAQRGVEVWAYCLMPNHVHLIAVPESEDSLARAIGEAHRRYTRQVNFREGWRGHLWQGRFASFVLDEPYLRAVARYVAMNPVRAGLVGAAEDWPWSSARVHLSGGKDPLVRRRTLLRHVPDFAELLRVPEDPAVVRAIRLHDRTGRPLGSESFVEKLERVLGHRLKPHKRGPRVGTKGTRRQKRGN